MRGLYKKLTYEDKFARKYYCNSYRFLPDMKRRNRRKLRRLLKLGDEMTELCNTCLGCQAQEQEIEQLKEKNKKLNNENIFKQLQKEKLLQEVNEQVEQIKLLEGVAKDLYFAYANKDTDCPHEFETRAIEKYIDLLGGKEDGL